MACITCHTKIPHSTPRPRLLNGAADAAHYKGAHTLDISNTGTPQNSANCKTAGTVYGTQHAGPAPYWRA